MKNCPYCYKSYFYQVGDTALLAKNPFVPESICDYGKRLYTNKEMIMGNFGDCVVFLENLCSCSMYSVKHGRALYKNTIVYLGICDVKKFSI
jgi:hypothetical protein